MSGQGTRERIEQVIEGMRQAGSIMTISGVAREVGVSNATIHNRYPDLAEYIRELAGKAAQRDAKTELEKRRGRLKAAKNQIADLREEIAELKESLVQSRSVNASLVLENESLQAKYNEANKLNREYLIELNRFRGR